MPKKPIRNAFYYFMLDFKEEQRRNGVNYENMAKVADAADPLWKNAVPAVRAKFEAIAKEEKQLKRQMDQKLTSTGVPVSFIENHEKELQAAEEFQRQDIKNIVEVKSLENTLHLHSFFIMDVNAYCQVGEEWMIGESSLLQFNLQDGILNHYHENINPGNIPMGYASDVKIGCQQLGLEMPFDEPDQRNYKERILSRIVDYITQQGTVKPEPPIYTMPNKIEKVTNFIHQLCYRSGEDESKFRVYGLPALLHSMTNALRSADNEGFPTETLALKHLERDSFKYMPKEACEHHETLDMSVECTLSRTKRWAFMVFDSCCQLCGVDLQPGKHLPLDLDIDSVIIAKEEARQRGVRGATLGDGGDASSCNTSLDQSYGAASSISESSKPKRVHKPLRLPKTDHLQKLERPPELTLDADNFPVLGVSRGRGRGLSSSLGSMNINRK